MIEITERAKRELKDLLSKKVDWPEARLRLIDRGQGKLGLGIDVSEPGDLIVEYEGKALLLIDNTLAASLKGIILDVDDTPDGAELVISESS